MTACNSDNIVERVEVVDMQVYKLTLVKKPSYNNTGHRLPFVFFAYTNGYTKCINLLLEHKSSFVLQSFLLYS